MFILFAHPEPKSFTASILNTLCSELEKVDCEVKVTDLYQMKFPYVETNTPHKDEFKIINYELEKLKWCKYFILVFPYWWSGMPCLMKGWFDRVLIQNECWSEGSNMSEGLLKGKTGVMITCVGGKREGYKHNALHRSTVKRRLHYINWNILKFCGIEPLEPVVFYNPYGDEFKRQEFLNNLGNEIKDIDKMQKYNLLDL